MERSIGTVVRGLRAPIIKEGDDLVQIVVDSIINAAENEGYDIQDRDIIAITESIVARAQGNYANIDDIATDIKEKFQDETVGVLFPILSRNRFMNLLKGFANVAIIRHYDNWMRKRKGQAWLDYKDQEAIRRTNALLK